MAKPKAKSKSSPGPHSIWEEAWPWNINWYQRRRDSRTRSQRLADSVTSLLGSWRFIIWQSVIVLIWLLANIYGAWQHWDPYPFILLNLLFSVQAAYTAPIIMMAQNRQSERDRVHAEADFKINREAKKEIEEIQVLLNRIERKQLKAIMDCLSEGKSKSPRAKRKTK